MIMQSFDRLTSSLGKYLHNQFEFLQDRAYSILLHKAFRTKQDQEYIHHCNIFTGKSVIQLGMGGWLLFLNFQIYQAAKQSNTKAIIRYSVWTALPILATAWLSISVKAASKDENIQVFRKNVINEFEYAVSTNSIVVITPEN